MAHIAVLLAVYAACVVLGWRLGRAEGNTVGGVLFAMLLGPLGVLVYWAGRDWRRDLAQRREQRDEQRSLTRPR